MNTPLSLKTEVTPADIEVPFRRPQEPNANTEESLPVKVLARAAALGKSG